MMSLVLVIQNLTGWGDPGNGSIAVYLRVLSTDMGSVRGNQSPVSGHGGQNTVQCNNTTLYGLKYE